MARYFFQVRTETHVMHSDGVELEDLEAARVEAAVQIGALLQEHAAQLWVDEDWQMDVTNEQGLILFIIQVSAMKTAATAPRSHA